MKPNAWTKGEFWKKVESQSQTTFFLNKIDREGQKHVNLKVRTLVRHPDSEKEAEVFVRASVPLGTEYLTWKRALRWMSETWEEKFGKCANGPLWVESDQMYHGKEGVLHILEYEERTLDGGVTCGNAGECRDDGSFTGEVILGSDEVPVGGNWANTTIVLEFREWRKNFLWNSCTFSDAAPPTNATILAKDGFDFKESLVRTKTWEYGTHEHQRFKGEKVWIEFESREKLLDTWGWLAVLASRPNVVLYTKK